MAQLQKYMNKDNHKRTLVIANSLLKKYPEKDGYNFPRGVAYLGLGKINEANAIANEFLKKDKTSLNGMRLKGRIFLAQGKGDSAIFYLNQANREEMTPFYTYLQGKAHNMVGEHDLALTSFNASLTEDQNYQTYRERGVAYMALSDSAKGRADLDKAISMAPKDPVNWNARGFNLWAATGQHEKAKADYNRAIKLNANYAYAFSNRGWSKFKLGEIKAAAKDYRLSEKRLHSNPYLQRNKALLALSQGDNLTACGLFQRALEMNFTELHGTEVLELTQVHCPNAPEPVKQKQVTEPKSSPRRDNAPGG